MSSKHTPGPWTYQENSDAYTHIVRGPTNCLICQLSQSTHVEIEANARLIAAAPEMLQALTAVVEAMDKGGLDELMCCNGRECGCRAATNGDLLVHELRALIAEATGEQP